MNPYDLCVCNNQVSNKKISLIYHIDDLMLSHVMAQVVTLFIKKSEREYWQHDKLTVTCGFVHKYLGMTIDFRMKQASAMSLYNFVKKLYILLPNSMKHG